ncbi:hypothetical protein [Lactobacillus helveticus]|uniref:hypothetical protein n=1 Tax=Lactobacillus helveticus TaxID=1587 RepID=UPI001C64DDE6|nr:hypothetical protein [Lactobacillus helveticus]MBW8009605.1 hypothetical protein [Lactobacillus helveticus]MBW8019640.1 hypothetical protein [Lactobacillus helveticus]MBW8044236.1 hypothetical protein [Lactobacillus helveticus]
MKAISIRLSENQQTKLNLLTAKTGYTQSEIIRTVIDNLDEVKFDLAVKNDKENRKVELQKIADLRYQNYLFSNVTKNVNEIAKYVNQKQNVKNNELIFQFNEMKKDIQELEKKLSDYYGNS